MPKPINPPKKPSDKFADMGTGNIAPAVKLHKKPAHAPKKPGGAEMGGSMIAPSVKLHTQRS